MKKPIYQNLNTDKLSTETAQALEGWIIEGGTNYGLIYLLAHAEDGVIWGKIEAGKLTTSGEVFPQISPGLRLETLQQCRIFGDEGEIFLWKCDRGWKARLIPDETSLEYIPECQILWGTKSEREEKGFTLVTDGSQGLRHAVPLTGINDYFFGDNYRPIRLSVKHYIDYDEDTGIAFISCSRLVSLQPVYKSRGKS